MISLKHLLEDIDDDKVESEKVAEITIDSLEQTLYALEKLASPDREVDTMAKIAVLLDLGFEQEKIASLRREYIKYNQSERANEEATIALKRALKDKDTAKKVKETEAIKAGKKGISRFKVPAVVGLGMLGAFHLGGRMSDNNRKDELKGIARRHY